MARLVLPDQFVPDEGQRRNNEAMATLLNELLQFFSWGDGAPTHTPTGPQFYIRRDGGAGTTFYCWSGAAWAAFA